MSGDIDLDHGLNSSSPVAEQLSADEPNNGDAIILRAVGGTGELEDDIGPIAVEKGRVVSGGGEILGVPEAVIEEGEAASRGQRVAGEGAADFD
ncbi:hypothetical protein SASPL_129917 [Salvia splendens]|uniref:Uncharacterized protein n=1 Tax=Salvia splendens TaxID=180675 RepID=A0A8X8XE73_SALSN|nr:hypothetical protein SASPL_129917 [Salvia splendens]